MNKILKMRIHRFGDSKVLEADSVEPSLPDAAQALVSMRAASINPVDFKIRSGKYPSVKEDRPWARMWSSITRPSALRIMRPISTWFST